MNTILGDAPAHAGLDVGTIIAEIDASISELRCVGSQQLVRAGVSMAHLHVMWLLKRHGDLSMGRLAEMLDVSLSNASGLIDRMVERGLVERVRVPDDRRLVLVALSDHGRQMLAHADVLRSDLLETVLRRLDADQLMRVAVAMTDIRQAIQAAIVAGELPGEPHPTEHATRPTA
jgi:DNA-binding MarR family transcriptional regulator